MLSLDNQRMFKYYPKYQEIKVVFVQNSTITVPLVSPQTPKDWKAEKLSTLLWKQLVKHAFASEICI